MKDAQLLLTELQELERAHDGTFALRVVSLDTDETFALREREILPTASAFKLFVLCELFRQARAGEVDLQAPITWKPEFLRGGDGVLRAMKPGQTLSVINMATLMMIVSDNTATATLVDLLGPERVTEGMRALGLRDTNIYEGLPGGPNGERMKPPVSTAYDLSDLMVRIYHHQILTPADCDEIIRILRANRCNDMLPRYIPMGEDWGEAPEWIANKTGYGLCRVEVGVVHTKRRSLAMAMFFQPRTNAPAPYKCIADYPPVLAMAEACRAVFRHVIEG